MAKPSNQDVSKRILILKYVVVHALTLPPQDLIKHLFSNWSKNEQQEFTNGLTKRAHEVVSSIKTNKLWNIMTKEEQEFIQSIPPKTKFQQHLNAMWSLESAAVLMWSLGLITDFPSFDNQSDPEILNKIPHEDINKFINNSRLLSESEIERKRSLAELWHWRSRTRQLVVDKKVPPPNLGFVSFEQIVQKVAYEAQKQGDLSEIIDNDFLVKGKSYRDLSDDEWSEVRSITIERHRALNWLCGYAKGNQWEKTPTDT